MIKKLRDFAYLLIFVALKKAGGWIGQLEIVCCLVVCHCQSRRKPETQVRRRLYRYFLIVLLDYRNCSFWENSRFEQHYAFVLANSPVMPYTFLIVAASALLTSTCPLAVCDRFRFKAHPGKKSRLLRREIARSLI